MRVLPAAVWPDADIAVILDAWRRWPPVEPTGLEGRRVSSTFLDRTRPAARAQPGGCGSDGSGLSGRAPGPACVRMPTLPCPGWLPAGATPATRWGRGLVWVGALLLVAGMFNKPPVMNAGLGCGLVGLLALRPAVWRWPALWLGLAFGGWIVLSVVAGGLRGQPGSGRIQSPAFSWLALPIVAVAARDLAWRGLAMRAVLIVAALAFVVALLQWSLGVGDGFLSIHPGRRHFGRAIGLNQLPLTYGFVSSILLVAALAPGEAFRLPARWLWAGRAMGLVGPIISGTRGAMLGMVVGVSAALAARGRRWLLWGAVACVVLAAVALGTVFLSSERRFSQMMAGENGRWPIWGASAVIVADHPVLGIGGRNAFEAAYPEAYVRSGTSVPNEFAPEGGRAPHAHNNFLALAAEYGLPAVLLHLAVLAAVLAVAWQRRRASPAGWQLAAGLVSAGIVAGMFEPYQTQSVGGLAYHAWLGLALGTALGPEEPPAPAPA